MAASIKASEEGLQIIDVARKKRGWTKKATAWRQAADNQFSDSTLDRFWAKTLISQENFVAICKAVGEDWERIADLPTLTPVIAPLRFSAYNPQTFTGRDAEIEQFTMLLSGSCRILAITGMTGIGKTALAERVVANLMEIPKSPTLPYIRFSLDDRSLSPDFSITGSALLRTLGEEPTLADQQDSANLLAHILKRLCSNPCRLQIDSLERLLKGNEQEGWSEFCDPLWLDLLHQFILGNDCPSQLLLTSQDITGDLDAVASRYSEFYQCQTLRGLKSHEQQEFFQKLGLFADPDCTATDLDYLNRIGAFYDGHPLVLQVIADEILQPPFQGNIARYWHHYEAEFSETAAPTMNKLARSRLFHRRVRQRVEQTIQRLPSTARQMLCACAVFRRPVPIGFWLAMLIDEKSQAAFDTLQDRHLVEFVSASDNTLLVRQHNLIRSVAYDLLKANASIWEQAERRAANLWLTEYKPAPDAPNLETVRGYLEAFEHYYELEDWGSTIELFTNIMNTPAKSTLSWQLDFWGYFQEEISLCQKLLGKGGLEIDLKCWNGIGNGFVDLGNYPKTIEAHKNCLRISRKIGDRSGESNALGNLGITHKNLGQYQQSIEFHQQALIISQEIGNRRSEETDLSNLGVSYNCLGQYQQAITVLQKSRTIAKEIGDRSGEGRAMGNLGVSYNGLSQYQQAIDLHQDALTIAREVGHLQAEGTTLGRLGIVYNCLGEHKKAIDFHQQHLSIVLKIRDRQGEGSALVNIGGTLLKLGEHSASLHNNREALKIFQEIGYKVGEVEALKNLAEVRQTFGEVEAAQQHCQKALALAIELDIPLAAECQTLMEQLDREAGEAKIVQEEIS
jgi:tetratricopeptide (TPR) repeat protein